MPLAIDEFSLTTVPIDLRFNEQPISSATAFTWERHDMHFLITNWHNVSGRDPNTDEHISKTTAAEPNMLSGLFNAKGTTLGHKHPVVIHIRQDSGEVAWLVHPTHKRGVDVVAIPLTGEISSTDFSAMNKMGSPDLEVRIGMDVFVLGYPFGRGKTGLPIWKRGSIASEPDFVPHVEKYLSALRQRPSYRAISPRTKVADASSLRNPE